MRRGFLLWLAALLAFVGATSPVSAQTRSCSWAVEGSGTQANVLFPDQAATYWSSNQAIPQGGYVEIHGWFPHARYTSLTTYTGQAQSIDGLKDVNIVPDPGSSNPYLPGADRTVEKREYTVRLVRGQVPAGGREPNTIYTTSADGSKSGGLATQRLSLRIYEGDQGQGRTGGVPLPQITLVAADGTRTTVPDCPDSGLPDVGLNPTVANAGSGEPSAVETGVRGEDPPRWRKFTGTGAALTDGALGDEGPEGGFGDNPDNKYVYSYFSQNFGQVLVFKAKAPTYAATYDGQAVMGTGQLRYWSFCSNAQTTMFYGCKQDDQIPTDKHGYYTIVVSRTAARPRNATEACGVAWVPAGPLSTAVLILRNMLPDPSFAQAIQNASPGTEAATMGKYYPRGTYYATTADFERLGCAGATGGSR
jgi:hypothetical protein